MLRLKAIIYPGCESRRNQQKKALCRRSSGIQLILFGIMQLATALQDRHLHHVSQKDEGHQATEQLVLYGAWQGRLSQQPRPNLPPGRRFSKVGVDAAGIV